MSNNTTQDNSGKQNTSNSSLPEYVLSLSDKYETNALLHTHGPDVNRTSNETIFLGDSGVLYTHSLYPWIQLSKQFYEIMNRHNAIVQTFQEHCEGFPDSKRNYIAFLANAICRLEFTDNVSYYNDDDNTIETILRLNGGLKLSITQFLEDDVTAPVVFSIHRGKTLLVSDDMPVNDIVETINSVRL